MSTPSSDQKTAAAQASTQPASQPANPPSAPLQSDRTAMWQRVIPIIAVILTLVFLASRAPRGQNEGVYDLDAFSYIPVSADGRVKPMDTVARTSLQIINGRSELRLDDSSPQGGQKIPAIRWLVETMAMPEQASNYPVFRIDHPDVLRLIGVQEHSRTRYSFNEILAHENKIVEQVQLASQVASRNRNAFQKHLMELWSHLDLYMNIMAMRYPYMIPPDETHKDWRQFEQVLSHAKTHGQTHETASMISGILMSYQAQKPEDFNRQVHAYLAKMEQEHPSLMRKTRFEEFFNQLSPFYLCIVLYVLVFVLSSFSFMMRASEKPFWATALGKAAFWVGVITFCVHTFGLAARIYIQGRPPVTNLYSSAVFIGWGAVMLGLLMELPFRYYISTWMASVIGIGTLIVAMNLAEGDTMEMMQAVLDSNFWLATHVIIVTAGYSATFVAGLIGIIYILMGTTTRQLTPAMDKMFHKMVYGSICFALLLSFAGTVLGGIWADQSWGRFWGWDPKENGAVLIVLWNALILHARWGGMVRTRGIMVLAVFGNIITSWSWFGTNMLGVGLHSYGFMESAVFWLAVFMMSQLGVMLAGMIPLSLWKSHAMPLEAKSNV